MLDGIIDDWIEPAAEINMTLGLSREEAVAHARLGIAVTRGLLLDLVATRDVEGSTRRWMRLSRSTRAGYKCATPELR
jgi:hypothetical protein